MVQWDKIIRLILVLTMWGLAFYGAYRLAKDHIKK